MRFASSRTALAAARRASAALLTTLSLSCILSLAAPAEAIVGRHDRPSGDYDTFGAATTFQAVGSLFVFNTGGASGGTGTLITPEWVLTAAHVTPSNALIAGSTFSLNGTQVPIAQIVRHPLWTGNIIDGFDISLVRLASPINSVIPAQLFTGSNELAFGTTAINAGFGLQGNGTTGGTTGPNARRAGQNDADIFATFTSPTTINVSPVSGHYILQDFDDPRDPGLNLIGSTAPRNLEGLIAPGDSGGPLMMDIGGGNFRVAGVHSFITAPSTLPLNPQATYGWIAGSTRVSDNLPFILSTISAAAPEPATLSFGLFGVGYWVLGRGRHRRRR
jgi:hypothetical protein